LPQGLLIMGQFNRPKITRKLRTYFVAPKNQLIHWPPQFRARFPDDQIINSAGEALIKQWMY
jgi:hypothetical protein